MPACPGRAGNTHILLIRICASIAWVFHVVDDSSDSNKKPNRLIGLLGLTAYSTRRNNLLFGDYFTLNYKRCVSISSIG
jgi:hypothetical protein